MKICFKGASNLLAIVCSRHILLDESEFG